MSRTTATVAALAAAALTLTACGTSDAETGASSSPAEEALTMIVGACDEVMGVYDEMNRHRAILHNEIVAQYGGDVFRVDAIRQKYYDNSTPRMWAAVYVTPLVVDTAPTVIEAAYLDPFWQDLADLWVENAGGGRNWTQMIVRCDAARNLAERG